MNLRATFYFIWAAVLLGGVAWIFLASPSWLAVLGLWLVCFLVPCVAANVIRIQDARHRRRYQLPREPYDYTLLRDNAHISTTADQPAKRS